jgi:ribosomal protein S18 acetylase RimI-like enzyme
VNKTDSYTIIEAVSTVEIKAIKELFIEYSEWMGDCFCFQDFDEELATLPGKYASPEGRLYLLMHDNNYVGCIALRKLEDGVSEMKRLYIKPEHRGAGLGKKLVQLLIEDAKKIGYEKMRLDTIRERMTNAVDIYEKHGFRKIEAYYHNPISDVLYMELDLK